MLEAFEESDIHTKLRIKGIVPVMLTPFERSGEVDYAGLESLIEWYLANQADALFAVCQSSEMQKLSLAERVGIAKFVVEHVNGRVPVIASGHISAAIEDQSSELAAIAATGVDAIVLVTNRLDAHCDGFETFEFNLRKLFVRLPSDLPLGLYECPAPFRRLLSDDELRLCCDTGRFVVLKDVSCDLNIVKRRIRLVADSELTIINANAAIAHEAMKVNSPGFAGVFTNFHPDLYSWLYENRNSSSQTICELASFLALSACSESMGYPGLAKLYHQRIGTIANSNSRVIDYDLRERHWAIDNILDHIHTTTVNFRNKIANGDL